MRSKQVMDVSRHIKKVVLEPKPKEPTPQDIQQKILDELQQINQRLATLEDALKLLGGGFNHI